MANVNIFKQLHAALAGNILNVATAADLPVVADVEPGAIRFVVSEGIAYLFDGTVWAPMETGGGSAVFTNLTADTLTVNVAAYLPEIVEIKDNIIVLNSNAVGPPTEDSGIQVNRGSSTNAGVIWNETTDRWQFGLIGTLQDIASYPTQTGNAGKYLTTNGTTPSWASIAINPGTVTSVSVTTANGVSGTVTNPTSTPAISLTLGAITPTSVNGTTATEIGYVAGVTSSIQTQLAGKEASIVSGTTGQYWRGDKTFQTLNTLAVPELTNLYYTDARARLSLSATAGSGLSYVNTTGVFTLQAATTSQNGYLSSVDWNTFNNKQATITGAATTITSSNLAVSRAVVSDGSGKIAVATTTATEVGYLAGVTSAIQTQINAKQATITGGATTIVSVDLTATRALVSDGSGKVAVSTVTSTEIGYVAGVTSSIQTQINNINTNVDGGSASSVYTAPQVINGGTP